MESKIASLLLFWMLLTPVVLADETISLPDEQSTGIEIAEVQVTCQIDGRQLAVSLDFEAVTKRAHRRMLLIRGDAVLEKMEQVKADYKLDYNQPDRTYHIAWPRAGRHRISAAFVAKSEADPNSLWRQASLQVPFGRMRRIRLVSDRPDLEVSLPSAMRVERKIENGQLIISAILGPRQSLMVRWKPLVTLADAKLVLSSQANTVVDVRAGLLHVDALFDFQVAQGKIENLTFAVSTGLSITAIDGTYIRNWTLKDPNDGLRYLVVELSRPQEKDYRLCIRAEADIDMFPAEVEVPAIEPVGGIRSSGHLAVGTDSALQLVVVESSGLTQIDAAVFPRVQAGGQRNRSIPQSKVFFYTYAGRHYRLGLSVDDIVPSYDVAGRFVVKVKEDDLIVDAELELDVRDAPVRQLEVVVPAGMVVVSVDGNQVEDYHLSEMQEANEITTVRTVFVKPVIGRTLIHLRLELGHGPLDQKQTIPALRVTGAKIHRGYVVVATEAGIEIDDPLVENLRQVHTASVPLRVAQAEFAYRFRQADWTLSLTARSKPTGIRAEVFHLQSIGEALAYGSAVINYIITGSPVDELRFSLPESFENIEFVGSDVRRWTRQGNVWVVKLTRKVIGDYNIAVTYTQQYGPGRPIQLGSLHCRDVQTQTGYVVVTSHLDLKLQLTPGQDVDSEGLLPITMDELPGDYRLMTSSPILSAYKYVTDAHTATLSIDPYRRSGLLPVILDISALQTRLGVRPDGQIESVTTIRYKVKNTTGQFLSLAMPEGTRVWAVSLIETKDGREKATRLAASYDTKSGRLLVPLSRKANPNDPTTVELEYGQVHKSGGWWRRRLDLTAPLSAVPITYADWHVAVPDEWAITADGGNMQPQPRRITRVGLAWVLNRVGQLWTRSIEELVEQPVIWILGIVVLVLYVLCLIFFRRWLPELISAILLIMLVMAGIGAAMSGRIDKPAPATLLSYAQAVNTDPDQALQVSAVLIPAWRQHITAGDVFLVFLVIAAALAIIIYRRRLWPIAVAAVLVSALYFAARIPVTWSVLKVLMTWGGPTVVSVWCLWRVFRRFRQKMPVPAKTGAAIIILLIGLLSVSGGCAGLGPAIKPVADRPMIESIECYLSAGVDSMELQYKLRISADKPSSFPLLDESAVLVSPLKLGSNITVRTEDGWHTIEIKKANVYEMEATFLVPLPPIGEDRRRRFELPMPMALTNSVSLTVPDANVLIDAPQAVHLVRHEQENQTIVETMFMPGAPVVFTWQPKERQASQEEIRFYAQDVALANLTSGLLQVFHSVRLQIAQGQIDTLKLGIAGGETVTSVSAPHVGGWRFDPAAHQLEVRLTRPVTGTYELLLVTQSASASVPYDVRLEPLVVHDALNQHSVMGLATDPSVYVRVDKHPASMNAGDYIRDSAGLIKVVPGLTPENIKQAFRFDTAESVVAGRVLAVQSELRSQETARFNAEDDRLIYNSQWVIEIAKAGRFDVVLQIPEGFDIDTLVSEQVSHWDESVEGGRRLVRVHFKRKFTGSVRLKLTLSQPVTQMPEHLTVPRVMLEGVLKHKGYLVVGSEQGVRLSVAARQGVSEVNPAELGYPGQNLLAFRLLRPDWQLQLQTELVQPRLTVQALHLAKITEGLVRHHHYLWYRLFQAGTKVFEFSLPSEASGVTITGPRIARREQLGQGNWRVELADKVYDRPYLLRVTYETQYNQANGKVQLIPVRCRDVYLQQVHTVVFATERVELSADSTEPGLRPAEARSIPKYFGAGDLSGAAMCYRSTSPELVLTVQARRHAAAKQIGADVQRTDIATVVTQSGQAIHRVALTLRVGTQRHLQTILPEEAEIWSLSVDGQAVQPSIRKNTDGDDVLLVPLPQQASDNVVVDMVYVAGLPSVSNPHRGDDWSGVHQLSGPRFDLPLKQITWHVYVPEGFKYDDFGGTLTIDRNAVIDERVLRYNLQYYERQILEVNSRNDQFAQQQQKLARELAQKGRQADARRALAKGYNFSRGNRALNEDIRVDLDNLLRQQAKVGLVNARGRLRQQASGTAGGQGLLIVDGASVSFSQQQAERIESSLGQADSENLELITQRIIQTQEAAEGSVAQLNITMPYSGKLLRFDSPLQVEPKAEMAVIFRASPQRMRDLDSSGWYGLSLFAGLLIVGGGIGFVRRRWDRMHEILTPAPKPEKPTEPTKPGDKDEPDSQVSAKELI
ncbi:MAG: hypothetical protein GWN67_11375 [Phycisphaerae bacterium]|nr:hypothetical protein [Phycisphaerae bacterium]NIU09280.1 hypothetical protein [Phycisphaerae bacterium]NIU56952.1 hypothetical protein [Phycisphaerae bacterium]NIW93398.1 hypothetical protein [Phycisphaerae bacterium]NIW98976.1 hypothetical protein [Phycisphaerae bacterium]